MFIVSKLKTHSNNDQKYGHKRLEKRQNYIRVFGQRYRRKWDLNWFDIYFNHSFNIWKPFSHWFWFVAQISLDKYRGHTSLVVNVASNCGLTKNNYKQLNEIYDKYESKGLRILAFPSNQFNGQEPGCDIDIKEFAKKNGVKFDMFSKVDVNGL